MERVHAMENRALSNELFTSTGVHKEYQKGDQKHRENMKFMAGEVKKCLNNVQYGGGGGAPVVTMRGIGEEGSFVFNDESNLLNFLSRNERLKNECAEQYFPTKNKLWEEVALLWDLDADFVGCYRTDYQTLENMLDEEGERTCWASKYSTTILSTDIDDDKEDLLTAQPIPDFVR